MYQTYFTYRSMYASITVAIDWCKLTEILIWFWLILEQITMSTDDPFGFTTISLFYLLLCQLVAALLPDGHRETCLQCLEDSTLWNVAFLVGQVCPGWLCVSGRVCPETPGTQLFSIIRVIAALCGPGSAWQPFTAPYRTEVSMPRLQKQRAESITRSFSLLI